MPPSEKRPTQPLVSVIVPSYNMEEYLSQTLDSILASDYGNMEVIVMDDGSRDRSHDIAIKYSTIDSRAKAYRQVNAGVSAARNNAISHAIGKYILPVDADNLIEPTFIKRAVEAIESEEGILAVAPSSDFFGARTGLWKLKPFSIKLLARKNMLDACALYRRDDWVRCGGYPTGIRTREDWAFWISMLKDGGKVVRLSTIEHHYRIRSNSKRVTHRNLLPDVIRQLNALHPEFFERVLRGPLRRHRSLSLAFNTICRICHPRRVVVSQQFDRYEWHAKALPAYFHFKAGELIHSGRNEIRILNWGDLKVVAKSFGAPNLINRIAYGFFRASKAKRSFEYAKLLRSIGVGSPEPVAWYSERALLMFTRSYYVSLPSTCTNTYIDLLRPEFPAESVEPVARAIAHVAAIMHNHGIIHRDFSRGNILFSVNKSGKVDVEIIDLNRIRFHTIGIEEGCLNFSRLPANEAIITAFAKQYSTDRDFDYHECLRILKQSPRENV